MKIFQNNNAYKLASGVSVVLAGWNMHLDSKKMNHVPTIGYTAPYFTKVIFQAVPGMLNINTSTQQKSVKDLQRQRITGLSPEVKGVNVVCDEHNIPLSEKLADLFVLQHALNPVKGSPLDIAFEQKIIGQFQLELQKGITPAQVIHDISENIPEEQRKLINAFSLIGVAAHGAYSSSKRFANRFFEHISKPDTLNNQRFNPKYNDTYDSEIEFYKNCIEDALNKIEDTLSQPEYKEKMATSKEFKANIRNELAIKIAKEFIFREKNKINSTTLEQEKLAENDQSNGYKNSP